MSPGKYHLAVPKDPLENLLFRQRLVQAAAASPAVQRGLWEMCRQDILFWIDIFVVQYNPLRKGDEYGPFLSWECQVEAIRDMLRCVEEGGTYVIEKSREMGGTYLCLLVCVWLCLFHRGKKVLVISRNAEAVDKADDSDSIFWKIDALLEHLPAWFGSVRRKSMRFVFQKTGSRITGTASTGKAGVGGRASLIFVDEFSQIEDDSEVRQRTASTADSRIFNGTHLGLSTEFYNLCRSPEVHKIQLHWTLHPEKVRGLYEYDPNRPTIPIIHDTSYVFPVDYQFILDGTPTGGPRPGVRSPWYDKKVAAIGDSRAVAMDLDINPGGSVSQFFDAILIRSLVQRAREPFWRGDLKYDADSGEVTGLVQRTDGPVKTWFYPTIHGQVPAMKYGCGIDVAQGTGATPSCVSLIAAQTGQKMLEYANNRIDPKAFGTFAVALCRLFKDQSGTGALMCWEKAGSVGSVFGQQVVDLGYRRIYFNTDRSILVHKVSEKPGWFPDDRAKGDLLRRYQMALKTCELSNPSKEAILECLKFEYGIRGEPVHVGDRNKKKDPGESGSNHGDLVIADALAWMMCQQIGKPSSQVPVDEVPYGSILWRRQERERAAREIEEPLETY